MSYFNVRVYGVLININNEVLISDEQSGGRIFSKFPGGGLELGEGLTDALKREFMEECNAEIEVLGHLYTTDFYEQSSFNDSQILSIYYFVKAVHPLVLNFKTESFDFDEGSLQSFRWIALDKLKTDDVTFKTDKTVVDLLLKQYDL
ncbi:MAG: NUDIX domain-containing protein [Candidatus Pedobacter colombiensis]|uniref:NUDIX domain-containing protein n=1 Tax=Candidatus Pedobacter colombiensis TaxID=3121371 RepID=A0AAJ6B8Y4_9SPHI|nr:NUDIX domain-containing protein [Pedobacter sp.]WEK20971.1 MAG: NUDIX domain-containing protein [Pedobacter sp.]